MTEPTNLPTVEPDPLTPVQRAWVTALRSGEYKQAQNHLTTAANPLRTARHCCLGVACVLAIADGVEVRAVERGDEIMYEGEVLFPPDVVRHRLGLRTDNGELPAPLHSLSHQNDSGVPFAGIADLIEKHHATLFVQPEPAA